MAAGVTGQAAEETKGDFLISPSGVMDLQQTSNPLVAEFGRSPGRWLPWGILAFLSGLFFIVFGWAGWNVGMLLFGGGMIMMGALSTVLGMLIIIFRRRFRVALRPEAICLGRIEGTMLIGFEEIVKVDKMIDEVRIRTRSKTIWITDTEFASAEALDCFVAELQKRIERLHGNGRPNGSQVGHGNGEPVK